MEARSWKQQVRDRQIYNMQKKRRSFGTGFGALEPGSTAERGSQRWELLPRFGSFCARTKCDVWGEMETRAVASPSACAAGCLAGARPTKKTISSSLYHLSPSASSSCSASSYHL